MSKQMEMAERIASAIPRLAEGAETRIVDSGLRIVGPRLERGPLRRLAARMMHWAERIEVELDDVGAFVVERMDGRSMHQLADDLAKHLKLSHREAEAALTVFLQMLLKRKLIALDIRMDDEMKRVGSAGRSPARGDRR